MTDVYIMITILGVLSIIHSFLIIMLSRGLR